MIITTYEWVIIGEAVVIAFMLFLLIARSGSRSERTELKGIKKDAEALRISFQKRYGELSVELRDIKGRIVNLLNNLEGKDVA